MSSAPTIDPGTASCSGSGSSTKATPPSGGLSGIVAHGACTVIGVPDTATLLIDVETQATTARGATDAANAKADAVIGGLRGKGLDTTDVRAGQLLVNPVISPILTSPVTGVGGTRITGFTASRLITATIRQIGSAATIMSSVLDTAGDAARVQMNYSIADDSALRAQARAAAVRQAAEKAKQMADAAGVGIGQMVSMTEVPETLPEAAPIPPTTGSASTSTPTASSGTVKGDGQTLTVAVDVVYAVD